MNYVGKKVRLDLTKGNKLNAPEFFKTFELSVEYQYHDDRLGLMLSVSNPTFKSNARLIAEECEIIKE